MNNVIATYSHPKLMAVIKAHPHTKVRNTPGATPCLLSPSIESPSQASTMTTCTRRK